MRLPKFVKRCSVCGRTIASWNKSLMCSGCAADIYGDIQKQERRKRREQNADKD